MVGCTVEDIRIQNGFNSQLQRFFPVVTLGNVLTLSQLQFLHL